MACRGTRNERQRADRADDRLADVDPVVDEVGERRDIRGGGEKKHANLQRLRRG